MAAIDDVRQLKGQGKTDQEIIAELQKRGIQEREIVNAISQSQIKEAVMAPNSVQEELPEMPMPAGAAAQETYESQPPLPQDSFGSSQNSGSEEGEYYGMQPSMINQPVEQPTQEFVTEGYPGEGVYGAENYPQYQPYQEAMSSDMITEISEQVVSERLAPLQDRIEKILDLRNVMESRMTGLNERLVRIEKIIDRLQVSILQKVGDYLTNVKDMKSELEETQKSFAAIRGHKKHSSKKR